MAAAEQSPVSTQSLNLPVHRVDSRYQLEAEVSLADQYVTVVLQVVRSDGASAAGGPNRVCGRCRAYIQHSESGSMRLQATTERAAASANLSRRQHRRRPHRRRGDHRGNHHRGVMASRTPTVTKSPLKDLRSYAFAGSLGSLSRASPVNNLRSLRPTPSHGDQNRCLGWEEEKTKKGRRQTGRWEDVERVG